MDDDLDLPKKAARVEIPDGLKVYYANMETQDDVDSDSEDDVEDDVILR